MSTPLSLIAQGTFKSKGVATTIELPKQPHYFVIKNRSTWGTAPTAVVQSEWFDGYGAGAASTTTEIAASALTATAIAAGGAGITFVDLSSQTPGALVATGTAITAANPPVVSDATSPPVGSIVRMLNTTLMLQLGGMDFTVTAVTGGVDFTLGYMDASGVNFVAANNADYRVIPSKYYSPYRRFISTISVANPCVIGVSVAHNYLVGDKLIVHVPAAYGMQEINNMEVTVTAVTAGTITTNVNSLAFTPLVWPNSADFGTGMSFPHICPVGEVATKLTSAVDNTAYYGMYLDTGVVGANTNVMDWLAFSRDYTV